MQPCTYKDRPHKSSSALKVEIVLKKGEKYKVFCEKKLFEGSHKKEAEKERKFKLLYSTSANIANIFRNVKGFLAQKIRAILCFSVEK